MKNLNFHISIISSILGFFFASLSCYSQSSRTTEVSIKGESFYINNEITYKGREFEKNKIEGLLMNSRMVQGIFDDLNDETRETFVYPDTKEWNADRNTEEFIAAMPDWKAHGLLAFTLNLQGGSPTGYGNKAWVNSAFDEKGNLRPAYMGRLEKILTKADELQMVVMLGYFYFGQDQYLTDEKSVVNAVENITNWIVEKDYKHLLIEINNECDIRYDHEILKPERVVELIKKVKNISNNQLLVSTSFRGNKVPTDAVIKNSDYVLLHGNGANPEEITALVNAVRESDKFTPKPIVFNEDDHYNYDKESNNFKSAIEGYSSWGYFDFRRDGDALEEGYQSVPVDWKISSKRKKEFFIKLKEVTGY